MAEKTEVTKRNPNEVRDLIYTALTLTEFTKVPILFMGNPGIAKTTGVRTWAEQFGYKVTTLIGTQRVAEEILGYMVNDTESKRLRTYTPDWFDEIMDNKKNNCKTLLFVDELSQAPDNVQGAMLQLIFDRKVGGRDNFLPDDCLVVSAANYKGNIPPQCGIQAPTLNRFCIVNVNPIDGVGLVEEFLQSPDERQLNIPTFQNIPITDAIEASTRMAMKECLTFMFNQFSKKDDKEIQLDVANTDFSDIFDQPGLIHNFITGRTLHYMYKMALGLIHFGIVRKNNKDFIKNVILGLGGLGTNNLRNTKEREDFGEALLVAYQKVLRKAVEENMESINATELNLKGKSIEKCIGDWMRHVESSGAVNDMNLQRILEMIKNDYGTDVKSMHNVVMNFDSTKFLANMQKIEQLCKYLKSCNILEVKPAVKDLEIIIAAYEAYKTSVLMALTNKA